MTDPSVNTALVVAVVGLIIAVTVQIVVIARWAGQVDGYIRATSDNFQRIDGEIGKLRDARHTADGKLAVHDGAIRNLERTYRDWDRRQSGTDVVDD